MAVSLPELVMCLKKEKEKLMKICLQPKSYRAEAEKIQRKIEQQLKQARSDASEMIKSSSISFQDKAQNELNKLDKELDAKIDDSSKDIENSKNESVSQIQEQINEITKLLYLRLPRLNVTDDEDKKAVKAQKVN